MDQTWSANPIQDVANIGSDVVGFFAGPPGDPGRIRQAASQIQSILDQFEADRTALNEAVDELTRTWTGDAAHAFADGWHTGAAKPSPAMVLADASKKLETFARQLHDYADQLEHAQHEHWIQMAVLAAMTVVNAAQLGMDPATDAVEVGEAAAAAVGSSFALGDLGTFAIEGAFSGVTSNVVAQLGADGWDRLDGAFDVTGDHAVGLFDPKEALSTAAGSVGGVLFGAGAPAVSRVLRAPATASIEARPPAPTISPAEVAESISRWRGGCRRPRSIVRLPRRAECEQVLEPNGVLRCHSKPHLEVE